MNELQSFGRVKQMGCCEKIYFFRTKNGSMTTKGGDQNDLFKEVTCHSLVWGWNNKLRQDLCPLAYFFNSFILQSLSILAIGIKQRLSFSITEKIRVILNKCEPFLLKGVSKKPSTFRVKSFVNIFQWRCDMYWFLLLHRSVMINATQSPLVQLVFRIICDNILNPLWLGFDFQRLND